MILQAKSGLGNKLGERVNSLLLRTCMLSMLVLCSCVDTMSGPSSLSIKQKDKWSSAERIDTEKLLEVDGRWNVVEQGRGYDPAQAHLNARKNVNVKRRKKKRALAAHFEPDAKSGQDGKLRVLRIEPNGNGFDEISTDYEIAESAVVKPTHTIAEHDLLKKISALFGANIVQKHGSTIIPKVKPLPPVDSASVSVSVTQLNTTLITPPQIASGQRKINDIIVPPDLPVRKRNILVKAVKPVPAMEITQNTDISVASSGIIIPKRKPSIGRGLHVKAEKLLEPVSFVPKSKPYRKTKPSALNKNSHKTVSVTQLRSGVHPGKTRVVIEISDVTKYNVAIDHLRNVLRVKLEKARWNIDPQDRLKGSPLFGTYVTRVNKDGSVLLEVRLKKKVRILDTMMLRPSALSKHRVVIDLVAL